MTVSTVSYEIMLLVQTNFVVLEEHHNIHMSKCLVKILDFCVQGHGHSKHSTFQLMFVWAVSSEVMNLFLTKLDMAIYCNSLGCLQQSNKFKK